MNSFMLIRKPNDSVRAESTEQRNEQQRLRAPLTKIQENAPIKDRLPNRMQQNRNNMRKGRPAQRFRTQPQISTTQRAKLDNKPVTYRQHQPYPTESYNRGENRRTDGFSTPQSKLSVFLPQLLMYIR